MAATRDARLAGFYRLDVDDRLVALHRRGLLSEDDARRLAKGEFVLQRERADKMIENVIGVFGLPFAVAPNFLVNDREYLVPMVVEEPSIVAGVSGAARLARGGGGFHVEAGESLLIGQIQLLDVDDPHTVIGVLHEHQDELLRLANVTQPKLLARGGGVRDIEYRHFTLPDGRTSVVLHLLVDTCDAMGANLTNSLCESIAPRVETLTGARAAMKILSNLADRSLMCASVTLPLDSLGGDDFDAAAVRDGIVAATQFADTDPYRAATHNKGIMNGIDAVAVATGNDWRAIEAGAHAFAVRDGAYRSLTRWTATDDGKLRGELRIPLKLGTVGGSLASNPAVPLALALAGTASALELAQLTAAVGLAQNFAALRALVTHGIQKGHMRLHARSVAASAGAPPEYFDRIVQAMIDSGDIKTWKADELVAELRDATGSGAAVPGDAATGTAFGKVILLGEHAAVYGKHALALPLPDAVTAAVTEVDGITRLSVPDWGVEHRFEPGRAADGAAAVLAVIVQQLGIAGRTFDIRVRARIPAAMGLGASAALAVALIRAFDRLLKLGLDNRAVDTLAFECEKLAHGTPSGIDNNLATYGEPVLFARGASSRTQSIALTESPPVVIASSGQRGITRDQVAGVRTRRERNPALYETIFAEIDELSLAGAVALRNADYGTLGALMNVCQGYLNAIEVSTPTLESMIHIARLHGAAGAKLTGAGGGGSIVALCPGSENAVAAALEQAGHTIIRMAAGNRRQ